MFRSLSTQLSRKVAVSPKATAGLLQHLNGPFPREHGLPSTLTTPQQPRSKMEVEWECMLLQKQAREWQALRELAPGASDSFYVVDLPAVAAKHQQWVHYLPRVEPFYAVKCNPDPRLLSHLAALGAGFDCASIGEMEAALNYGAPFCGPDRIIYANPCKGADHLEGARGHGVRLMTFDNHSELCKIARVHPGAELVLRILVDDSQSICQMGGKYGAPLDHVPSLLGMAKELDLNVRGVSFHVGSGCQDEGAFASAVLHSKRAFDMGAEAGYRFDLLDIGGGFPGSFLPTDAAGGISFADVAASLNAALDAYFPEGGGVRIIGEPGRFYATCSHVLAAKVIGRREPRDAVLTLDRETKQLRAGPAPGYMYYITDGLYGSFNCVLYDHVKFSPANHPVPLILDKEREFYVDQQPCSVWGPTCDGLDCVMGDASLPLLQEGDWLCFFDMGAYTAAAGSNFNGFRNPNVVYLEE